MPASQDGITKCLFHKLILTTLSIPLIITIAVRVSLTHFSLADGAGSDEDFSSKLVDLSRMDFVSGVGLSGYCLVYRMTARIIDAICSIRQRIRTTSTTQEYGSPSVT
jgi:hypothetical protein